jgi:hypothetical protein
MMKNQRTKHTPGPWETVIREDQGGIWAYIGPVNNKTGDIIKMDACNEIRQANAQLISAAPEMLQDLEMVLSSLKKENPEIRYLKELTSGMIVPQTYLEQLENVIEDTIKKARGEG